MPPFTASFFPPLIRNFPSSPFSIVCVQLGFFGWDDRLGSGFSNASSTEAQRCFLFLAITAFRSWARVLSALGDSAAADHFNECDCLECFFLLCVQNSDKSVRYAEAAITQARAADDFPFGMGIHAAAEAMIGKPNSKAPSDSNAPIHDCPSVQLIHDCPSVQLIHDCPSVQLIHDCPSVQLIHDCPSV
jgi:hypothetical protein